MTTATDSNPSIEPCIEECLQCVRYCSACVEESLAHDPARMAECIRLCHECAPVCGVCVTLPSGNSRFEYQLCTVCAEICEACAAECSKYPDMETIQQMFRGVPPVCEDLPGGRQVRPRSTGCLATPKSLLD